MGAMQVSGTEWTIAGMVAYTSGIPLATPLARNIVDRKERFLPGAVSLGTILAENGYWNEMILGSSKQFAGMDLYFEQHGDYQIFDLNSAISASYIEKSNDFWGFDDSMLFQIAKDRISEVSKNEESFHFLLNTIDLHSPSGYRCLHCRREFYDFVGGDVGKYMDAIRCQDAQINEFVEWCKSQDFYEDTVIVIVGDHTSMAPLVENSMCTEDYERTVFHVIINSDLELTNTENRQFTTMDFFPTILASLGFQIEGDRLGIGTNLYSGQATVMELMGQKKFVEEIAKNSKKYNKEILRGK